MNLNVAQDNCAKEISSLEIKIKISDTLEKMKVKLYFTRVINRVDTL